MEQQQRIIYGTQHSNGDAVQAIKQAVSLGYKAIDTANCWSYEPDLFGEALKSLYDQGYTREDFWLQSKFTICGGVDPNATLEMQIEQSLNNSLHNLQTNYLDSFLIHDPDSSRYTHAPCGSYCSGLTQKDIKTWRKLEQLQKSGLVRSIGVCHFSPSSLKELIEIAEVKPKVVQNYEPRIDTYSKEMFELCKKYDIEYQGFDIGVSDANKCFLEKITQKLGRSPKQVALRLALQKGITPITGTRNFEHMKENIDTLGFTINDNEASTLHDFTDIQLQAYGFLCGYKKCLDITDKDNLILARKFVSFSQLNMLQAMGADRAEEALKFSPDFEDLSYEGGEILEYLQRQKSRGLTFPKEEDILFAKKFTAHHQVKLFKMFGASMIDGVLEITSFFGGDVLLLLCKTGTTSLRAPTEEDVALTNRLASFDGLQLLEKISEKKFLDANAVSMVVNAGNFDDQTLEEIMDSLYMAPEEKTSSAVYSQKNEAGNHNVDTSHEVEEIKVCGEDNTIEEEGCS